MQTTRPMMDELNEQTGNLTLDPLEPVTVDPLQFDYSGQMGPNMESPGNFVAYDQQQVLIYNGILASSFFLHLENDP